MRAIRCPWHASIFRIADGEMVRGPAAIDDLCCEVKVDDGRGYVRSATSPDQAPNRPVS